MTLLNEFGWNDFHAKNLQAIAHPDLSVGRVTSIKGFKYFVICEAGELETELSGRLLYGNAPEELPKVGDWVLFRSYETLGYLIEVLPRINELTRKTPGRQMERQILATNVDCALVVQGLDDNFNIMRLDRYLVQLAACRIRAVVVLNKSDLVPDVQPYIQEVERLRHDCRLYCCSTWSGAGMPQLKTEILKPSMTFVLIGSSGVGKSSLLNSLMNVEVMPTGEVSDANSKGRHTTTSRELFLIPGGGVVIDTPGMREFGITKEEGDKGDDLFPAINVYSSQCHFADCTHTVEKGCGVLFALQNGTLDADVYESYLKLIREQRRFEIKVEDKKRLGKQAGKMSREANENRKRNKY